MKSLLTLFILIFTFSTLLAQPSWFEGCNLNDVILSNHNTAITVGGGFGTNHRLSTFLKTTDTGISWARQSKEAALYSASFIDDTNGLTVGDFGTIYHTTDGGENWIQQNSGTPAHFKGVSFVELNIASIVGSGGNIRRTTDGGQNWHSQSSGVSQQLNSVCFIDANNGWVVGAQGKILHTTDGGENWVQQISGTSDNLNCINFIDLNNGLAIGDSGTILLSSDAGENWVSQNGITNNNLYGAYYDQYGWTAVGEFGTIIRNGENQESGTSNRLNAVSYTDSSYGIAVGWFGTILMTTDGGNTWVNKFFDYVKTHHFTYDNVDRTYYVFLPSNYTEASLVPLMFVLNGSGGTGQGAIDASRMCSVADTSGFIAVYPNPVGNNWNLVNDVEYFSNLIDTVNSYYNINDSAIYVCGFSYGGYMTHQLGCQLSNKIAAIAAVAGTIQSPTISTCSSSASLPVFYMHGTLDNVVPFAWVQPTLNFWIERNQANASVDTVYLPDIDTTDGSTVIQYLYRNNEGIARVVFYKIVNGGHNWPGMPIESNQGNKNMDINTSQEIWNFVKDFDLVVGISEYTDLIPAKYNLFQNYPNPFNPSTSIQYQVSSISNVSLKVYDILGNEVATLVNEQKLAGSYEVEFNASQLSSGVYFYKLQAVDPSTGPGQAFIETKKMILLK